MTGFSKTTRASHLFTKIMPLSRLDTQPLDPTIKLETCIKLKQYLKQWSCHLTTNNKATIPRPWTNLTSFNSNSKCFTSLCMWAILNNMLRTWLHPKTLKIRLLVTTMSFSEQHLTLWIRDSRACTHFHMSSLHLNSQWSRIGKALRSRERTARGDRLSYQTKILWS